MEIIDIYDADGSSVCNTLAGLPDMHESTFFCFHSSQN
jgi:hypothetical protein